MTTSIRVLCIAMSLLPTVPAKGQADALVFNGSFAQDANKDGIPDGNRLPGRRSVPTDVPMCWVQD